MTTEVITLQDQDTAERPTLASLFLSFLRLGATAFGGPAMVAYIRKMAVDQHKWLDESAFRDGVALCQTIPGATAMQTAAYVGLRARGLTGAAASFTGFGLPAFIFMMVLSSIYVRAHSLPQVVSLFAGLQCIVVAIVANAAVSFGKNYLKTWQGVLIAGTAAGMFGLGLNPMLVIPLAAVLGLLLNKGKPSPGSPGSQRFSKGLILILGCAAVGFTLLFLFQRRLFDLGVLMLKIDLFAFGGGFASVPLMLHEVVDVRHWMNAPTFLDGIALGQVTPGPIVITATFVGYLLQGPIGGLVASISVFLPSFAMVVGIAPYFDRLRRSRHFHKAIGGVLCSFVGLLLTVAVRFGWNIHWDVVRAALAGAALAALLLKVDILWVVLAGSIVSVLCF